MKQRIFYPLFSIVAFFSCTAPTSNLNDNLDDIAIQYVQIALEIGQYDSDFIDAYYGPEEWRPEVRENGSLPYEELKWQTNTLIQNLNNIEGSNFSPLEHYRYQFLNKQLHAVKTKLDILSGKQYPFDVESLRLYDVVAPHIEMSYYDNMLEELEALVPGEGALSERYSVYSQAFIIPPTKLDTVFRAAIAEARSRVSQEITLPESESFELEYVTNKPWSGYNWYKGNAHSLIQINTDLPIFIERAIDLACHEGYPGHHVFNTLLEQHLVVEQNWPEFQVYPLFSPQSFIAEGSANYGIEVAFSEDERILFEKQVLFPLAGIDPSEAEVYYSIQKLRAELKSAEIQIARSYLNKEIGSEIAISHLSKYLQFDAERATQRLSFYDRYRSYIINYSYGNQIIKEFVEDELNRSSTQDKWSVFKEILSTPRTASTL